MLTEAEILQRADEWGRLGQGVAVATVIETFGSAPRPAGSHLVVNEAGVFHGSVSGGCVEGEVVTAALDAIDDGAPRLLSFGVADETAWRAGLPCGGCVKVYVERLSPARLGLLAALNAEHSARRLCALVTPLDGGDPWLMRSEDNLSRAPAAPFGECLRAGKSAIVEHAGDRLFVFVHKPPTRLIIVGAVHVAQALAPMARVAGFDLAIVDPRAAFAAAERFPGFRLFAQWPDEALPKIGLDAFTAVAALSHDPKIDDVALRVALASDPFYVGALGSLTSHARRLERLRASGVEAKALARLRAPIGLDIGAVSPAEIAVAIMGEIVLEQRQKPLRCERERAVG